MSEPLPILGTRQRSVGAPYDGVAGDLEPGERDLRCTSCQRWVRVMEVPRPFIDPAKYVCGDCLAARPT